MQTTNTQQTSPISASAIATEAYYQWLKAGQPAGRDQEFWLKAEAEVKSNGKATSQKPATVAKHSRAKTAAQR